MDKLRVELKNIMDMKDIKQSNIVKGTGVSKAAVSNFFTEEAEKRKEPKFTNMLKIIDYIDPDNFKKHVTVYMNSINKPENIKPSLEYCAVHKMKEQLRVMITKSFDHKNAVLSEWAKVYEIHIDNIKKVQKTELGFLDKLTALKTTDTELKLFVCLLKIYHYLYNYNYRMVNSYLLEATKLLEECSCESLSMSYQLRIDQFEGQLYLKTRKMNESAREHAFRLIDKSRMNNYKAYGYYLLGVSHFFDDYDTAYSNLLKSKELYMSLGMSSSINDVENKILLLKHEWGKIDVYKLSEDCTDDSEAIQLLVKGYKEDDVKAVYIAFTKFVKSGDIFFSELPKKFLLNNGEDKDLIESIQNINIA